MNSVLIAPPKERALVDLCQVRRAARATQRVMKSNASIATTGIITFSAEAQPVIIALPVEEQNRLYLEVVGRIANELNNTVTGLVVHRDESAPHAHFQMPAYNMDGIPMSKAVKIDMAKRLQDLAGAVYQPYGITRGKQKSHRIADGEQLSAWLHRSVRELHDDLPGELEAARQALAAALDKRRKNEDLAQKAQETIDARQGNLEKLQRNLQDYLRLAEAAQQTIANQENRLTQLRQVESGLLKDAPPPAKATLRHYEIVTGKNALGIKQTEIVDLVAGESVRGLTQSYEARENHIRKQAALHVHAAHDSQARLAQELRDKRAQLEARAQALDIRVAQIRLQESSLQKLATSLSRRPCSQSTDATDWTAFVQTAPVEAAAQILDGISQERYGALVQVFPNRVLIPSQQSTPAQKAAALYRVTSQTAQEQDWPGIVFTVQDPAIAGKLHALRQADGLQGVILLHGEPYIPPEILATDEAAEISDADPPTTPFIQGPG
ncbi:MAG: hypothetical protein HIU89_02620 [Proteobacteria bacterium]|nr:hypothetical protein [Pseudomonadota bacterium]